MILGGLCFWQHGYKRRGDSQGNTNELGKLWTSHGFADDVFGDVAKGQQEKGWI